MVILGDDARAPGRAIEQRLSVQQAPEPMGYLATPAAAARRRRGTSRARR